MKISLDTLISNLLLTVTSKIKLEMKKILLLFAIFCIKSISAQCSDEILFNTSYKNSEKYTVQLKSFLNEIPTDKTIPENIRKVIFLRDDIGFEVYRATIAMNDYNSFGKDDPSKIYVGLMGKLSDSWDLTNKYFKMLNEKFPNEKAGEKSFYDQLTVFDQHYKQFIDQRGETIRLLNNQKTLTADEQCDLKVRIAYVNFLNFYSSAIKRIIGKNDYLEKIEGDIKMMLAEINKKYKKW